MAKNLKNELIDLKVKSEILNKISCSPAKNKEYEELVKNGMPLPKDVYPYINDDGEPSSKYFYEVKGSEFTQEELMEYIALKQLRMVNTIKKCALYFTITSIIAYIIGAISAISFLVK
jgi:hypothetical protein